MQIDAYRAAGDLPGAPVTDSLLNGEASLLARATAELDAHAQPVTHVDIELPYTEGLRIGQRVEFQDPSAPAWIGRIIALSIKSDGSSLTQTLTLERPEA